MDSKVPYVRFAHVPSQKLYRYCCSYIAQQYPDLSFSWHRALIVLIVVILELPTSISAKIENDEHCPGPRVPSRHDAILA
jgi:hypothetical protein